MIYIRNSPNKDELMGIFKMPYVDARKHKPRRNSKVTRFRPLDNPVQVQGGRRIALNISGDRFETYEETLARFPNTLLGSAQKRASFYNPERREYYFPRDRASFDCILFYYQSNGMLTQPDEAFVPEEIFREEVTFYELGKAAERQLPMDFNVDFDLRQEKLNQGRGHVGRIWFVLDNPTESWLGKILGGWFVFIMVLFLLVNCMETLPRFRQMHRLELCCETFNGTSRNLLEYRVTQIWFYLGLFCSLCFGLEFLARFLVAPGKLRYFLSMGIIDFLSFAPHLALVAMDSAFVLNPDHYPLRNILKFLSFLCIFKVYRFSTGLQIFWTSIRSSMSELGLLLYCLFINVILFGSLMFYSEEGLNGFTSIPASFWYAVITMTTVGYGEMVTVSLLGKIFSFCCAIIGVTSLLALPTTVVVNNFNKYYQSKQRRIQQLKNEQMQEKQQQTRLGEAT